MDWISLLSKHLEWELDIEGESALIFVETPSHLGGEFLKRLVAFVASLMLVDNTDLPATSEYPSQPRTHHRYWTWCHIYLCSTHPRYGENLNADWLSTRQVDVEQKVPRLVITAKYEKIAHRMPRCLALSHIWGASANTRLVSRKFEQLTGGIDILVYRELFVMLSVSHAAQVSAICG